MAPFGSVNGDERGMAVLTPLLRRLAPLGALSAAESACLARLVDSVEAVNAGATLLRQGEPVARPAVLLHGWAGATRTLTDGRRQVLDFLLPGSLIATQAGLYDVSDCAVLALGPVTLAWLDREVWIGLHAETPRLAMALTWLQQREAAHLAERLASLGRRTARERLAHLLVELWVRANAAGLTAEGQLDLPVTQALLADALGLSAVHVNRSLQALRREGLLVQERGGLRDLDLEGLRRVARFDDDYLRPAPPARWAWDLLDSDAAPDADGRARPGGVTA
jgi:CRP-like cAMP-binding protein